MDWSWNSLIEAWAGHTDPVTRACQSDQRFSYGIYAPKGFTLAGAHEYGLTVLIHGSSRVAERLKNEFVDFAERSKTLLLAPMFPCGIIDPMDNHNYKFIEYKGIRFDLILLDMVEEVHRDLGINVDKFLLHGFSGGGQFTHRFFYLHPDRLKAVSIGAPGRITYLDEDEPWYTGIKDFEEKFGKPLDYESMKQVQTLLIVGAADCEQLNYKGDETYRSGEGRHGPTRVERLRSLHKNYLEKGIPARMIEVPGVGHENSKVVEYVKGFFIEALGLTHSPYATTEIGKDK